MNYINKFRGCLIGLALGDALCAPFEGGLLERTLWKFFSKTRNGEIRFTDDTQMCKDLAESIIAYKGINQDALAEKFASSYKWSRGYGPSVAKLLKKIKQGPGLEGFEYSSVQRWLIWQWCCYTNSTLFKSIHLITSKKLYN